LESGKNIVILKSRQVGASWTIAFYVAWLIHFKSDVEILLLSSKQDAAMKLLGKVRFIVVNFPNFIRREFASDSKTTLSVIHRRNGKDIVSVSTISSLTTTGGSGRGDTAVFVFCDELAHLPNAEETWTSIKPTTSRGGQIVAASSPAGPEGTFARLWMEADTGESVSFIPMRVHYSDCGFGQEWLEEASDGMTDEQVLQEFELAFIGAGTPAFNSEYLESCFIPMAEIMNNPDFADLRLLVEKSHKFASGVDTAEIKAGRGTRRRDFNAAVSLNEYGIQVAAEANKMLIDEWAGKTIDIGDKRVEVMGYVSQWHRRFPGTMFIEENGPGLTVENRHQLPDDGISEVVVRRTHAVRKNRLVDQFRLAIAGKQIIITDKATFYQLILFQDLGGGKYEAPKGSKDDLVIAMLEAYDALIDMGGFDFTMPAMKQDYGYKVISQMSTDGQLAPGVQLLDAPGEIDFPVDAPQLTPEDWNDFLPIGDNLARIESII